MKLSRKEIILVLVTLIVGFIVGGMIFGRSGENEMAVHNHDEHADQETIYTCSMHPQIRQNKPGLCPICAMDLVPVSSVQSDDEQVSADEIQMSESAIQLANIQTTMVKKGTPDKSINLLGKVQPDERNIAELTARYGGRIEKLYVNFTGQKVVKGEKLATIYSPELVSAQNELLEAVKIQNENPAYYKAAVAKLKLWDLTDSQIDDIIETGESQLYFDILAPISGTVTQRHVALGDYVKEGRGLFQVLDLSSVWVMFDAYENDLPWIKKGDKVDFTIQSLPGKTFTGSVSFVDPFIDAKTRVAKVRVNVPNKNDELKPEMFANGLLYSSKAASANQLLVPKTAVLWTGKRAVVYIKVQDRQTPSFEFREITLGPESGGFYVVANGLKEGDEIVTNGVFKVDAAAQLAGKKSMMNPKAHEMSASHDHDAMKMESMENHSDMANMKHDMFKVAGNCGMCKTRIEKAALSVDGVNSADWDKETKMLHLSYNPDVVKVGSVHKAIAKVGHDTELETAPQEVYDSLHACCLYERMEKDTENQDIQKNSFKVLGNCGMCKTRIEKAAMTVDGVKSAEWDKNTKMLTISFDSKIDTRDVHKTIAKVGHDTELETAPQDVYDALPGCCKYRD